MNIVIDIKQFVNTVLSTDAETCLYVSDEAEEIKRLSKNGHFVVPVLTEKNKSEDFSLFKYIITQPDEVDDDYYVKIWQRYAGIPWEILKTDRFIIREMSEDDVEELYKVYEDDSVTDYTEPLFPAYEDELEYTRNYIEKVYSYFGFGTWLIVTKDEGKIIGRAGFNYREGFDTPELGYVVSKEYQGKGVATEVCSAIIKYGFEELDFSCISAFSARENIPSLRLLHRLGFEKDTSAAVIKLESKGRNYIMDRFVRKRCE